MMKIAPKTEGVSLKKPAKASVKVLPYFVNDNPIITGNIVNKHKNRPENRDALLAVVPSLAENRR